jgi:hypothetical protein
MGKEAPKAQKEELERVVELNKARLEAHLATSGPTAVVGQGMIEKVMRSAGKARLIGR